MYEDRIEHLLRRKKEIDEVSPWARVKLRVIKDDLQPLIEMGVPIKHLLKILEPLEITSRKDTLRKFLIKEFPESYAKYYAKQRKAREIEKELGYSKNSSEEEKSSKMKFQAHEEAASGHEKPPEAPEAQQKRTAQKLDPNEISSAFSNFTSGRS